MRVGGEEADELGGLSDISFRKASGVVEEVNNVEGCLLQTTSSPRAEGQPEIMTGVPPMVITAAERGWQRPVCHLQQYNMLLASSSTTATTIVTSWGA